MTTLSHAVPSLEARVLAANLIVVGNVEEGPLSAADYTTDPPGVHSQFRVTIESALRGRAAGYSVTVRVLGGQVERLQTEWTSTMREGDRVLLFLTPYYAAEREADIFVPYFRGCYPVSADGSVTPGGRDRMTVEELRAFIEAVIQRREQANASLPEREQPEPEPSESSLTALLNVEPGGARWTTLESIEQARRASG